MKLLFELSIWADKLNSNHIFSNLINMYSRYFQDDLNVGERLMIFSLLILTLHDKSLCGDMCVGQFDIAERLHRLHVLFHNSKYESKMIDNINIDREYIDKIIKNKEYFSKWLSKALFRVVNNFALLKRIYIDRGVVFSKINISNYINTLNLLADITEDKMIVLLRDIGVLDNI